jgi:DMSO/TMAO reductase YedYZ molybdopterin-dependent catalytic subunit
MSDKLRPLQPDHDRRRWMLAVSSLGLAGLLPRYLLAAEPAAGAVPETYTHPFANGERMLVRYPQKRPLIELTSSPPQLETPFAIFNEGLLTPNDAFFVRYHNAKIPLTINPQKFRLAVQGHVSTPLSLSLQEIKALPQVEVVAVNQCSGNSRGFSSPRVQGGQVGHGAMGNAHWTGVRLADVLDLAGVAPGAVQVVLNGMDVSAKPSYELPPDFIKALEIEHAMDGEVILAYAMNGERLPLLNGFPLRAVVPGYYGTYWMKHLHEITVVDKPFNGFYMQTAYRIPDTACACVPPGTKPAGTLPIGRLNIRSFITSLSENARLPLGKPVMVRGICFDGGSGIKSVAFSADGGTTWSDAQLGEDLGKYSFREWRIAFTPAKAGDYALKARATNNAGQTQPLEAVWNPPGYMRNVVETINVTATKGG